MPGLYNSQAWTVDIAQIESGKKMTWREKYTKICNDELSMLFVCVTRRTQSQKRSSYANFSRFLDIFLLFNKLKKCTGHLSPQQCRGRESVPLARTLKRSELLNNFCQLMSQVQKIGICLKIVVYVTLWNKKVDLYSHDVAT